MSDKECEVCKDIELSVDEAECTVCGRKIHPELTGKEVNKMSEPEKILTTSWDKLVQEENVADMVPAALYREGFVADGMLAGIPIANEKT